MYWKGASVPKPGSFANTFVNGLPKYILALATIISETSLKLGVEVISYLVGLVCDVTLWFLNYILSKSTNPLLYFICVLGNASMNVLV